MIVYLTSQSAFAQGVPRSDSLFGAICWAIRWLYGEQDLADLLAEFAGSENKHSALPFVVSSMFPFFEDAGGKILFLPRPLESIQLNDLPQGIDAYRHHKSFRKARFVSRSVFEAWASGKLNEAQIDSELAKDKPGSFRLHGNVVLTPAEQARMQVLPSMVSAVELPRNSINRTSVATSGTGGQLFYQPVATMRALPRLEIRSGFFFLVRTDKPETTERIKAAMRFLADKGLGGDFSVGRGYCQVEFDDQDDIIGATDGQQLVTLSLMHPAASDLQHLNRHSSRTAARLERRKGFLESSFKEPVRQVWKPTLFMLSEGSTFPRDGERQVYGSLFSETPRREGLNFNLRINGLAYVVGMKGGEPR